MTEHFALWGLSPHPDALALRDARITEIYEGAAMRFVSLIPFSFTTVFTGTSEIQRLVIAQSVIKEIAGDACAALRVSARRSASAVLCAAHVIGGVLSGGAQLAFQRVRRDNGKRQVMWQLLCSCIHEHGE